MASVLNNGFRGGKTNFDISFPPGEYLPISGARFREVVLDPAIGNEVALFLIDQTDFAYEVKARVASDLRIKGGCARTNFGPVTFLLWWLPPITNGMPFALYELRLNPCSPGTVQVLERLVSQTHLHVILIGPSQKLIDLCEYRNTFEFQNLQGMETHCGDCERLDFKKANLEFETNYSLHGLFQG